MAAPTGGDAIDRKIDPQIVQRASEWMARLWSHEASADDHSACARWRAAHPEHERAWQRLQQFGDQLQAVPPAIARQALRGPATGPRRRALRLLGLGLGTCGIAYGLVRSEAWPLALADLRTQTGEIRETLLPDGTRLTLSTASAVDLRFGPAERLLVLRAGEILLASAPDPSGAGRPLRVQTRHGRVQALGTRFTVRQDTEHSRVQVFEGAVEIRTRDGAAPAMRIAAGQGASFSRAAVQDLGAVPDSAHAWSRGLLVADGMRLDDLLAELGRYRAGVLRCAPEVAALRVSGVFPLRDTDRALHNLARGLPVTVVERTRYWVTLQPR